MAPPNGPPNGDQTVVFDNAGNVIWTTSAISNHAGWRASSFACGDLDGSGEPDWVFIDGSRDLVIANTKGGKVSEWKHHRIICGLTAQRQSRRSGNPEQLGGDGLRVATMSQWRNVVLTCSDPRPISAMVENI
jgi:hypothetical protein